jgi:hypothetical protein
MRKSPRSLFAVLLVSSLVLAACGGSAKSDATASSEASSVETSLVVERSIAETTAADAPSTDVPSTDVPSTAGSATTILAAEAPSESAIFSQLITSLNGGGTPEPADVECLMAKVTGDDVKAMALGDSTNTKAFEKVFSAIFSCNPKGLAENFTSQTFVATTEITAEQKTCIGNKLVKLIATSPDVVKAIATNAPRPPDAFLAGGEAAITACVPAGPIRDSLIAELNKV